MNVPTVLFVLRDFSRSGAPLVMLRLLSEAVRNNSIRPAFLVETSGPQHRDFEALGPCLVWGELARRRSPLQRLARRLKIGFQFYSRPRYGIHHYLPDQRFDLAYFNGSGAAHMLRDVMALQIPWIAHIHELEIALSHADGEWLDLMLHSARPCIAASNAVARNLAVNHGVPAESIRLLPPVVDLAQVNSVAHPSRIRESLGLPENALLVMACGLASTTKGWDLFLLIAKQILNRWNQPRPLHFIWVGNYADFSTRKFIESDIAKCNMAANVRFAGEVTNPFDYLAAADVFLSTSREDSFPTACLEAAALANPIICFEHSGGIPEFVSDDCGFVVPYMDILACVEKLEALLVDPELRRRLGAGAHAKVAREYTVEQGAKTFLDIILDQASLNGRKNGY